MEAEDTKASGPPQGNASRRGRLQGHVGQCQKGPCHREGADWREEQEEDFRGADRPPWELSIQSCYDARGGGGCSPSSDATRTPHPILELICMSGKTVAKARIQFKSEVLIINLGCDQIILD